MQSFIFADYPLIPLMIKSPSVETTPKTADWVAELEKIPASLVGPDGDGCRWGSISGLSEYKQLKAFISNLLTQAVEDNEIDFTKRMEQVARGVRQEVIEEIVNKVTSLIKEPGDDAIIMPEKGCHIKVADGVFEQLMKELGIEPPEDVPTELTKWQCPGCGLNARMGIKGNPEIIHHPCSIEKGEPVFFVRADTLAQGLLGVTQGL